MISCSMPVPFPKIALIFSLCVLFYTEFLLPEVSTQSNFHWSTVCLAGPHRGAFAHDLIIDLTDK